MAGIRGKDTRPELLVRRFLHKKGHRFRLHVAGLPGRPDIVLPKWRVAIQVHGCFWHGHVGCRYYKLPGSRREFWLAKIRATRARDRRNRKLLEAAGWNVIEVWECRLRKDSEAMLSRIERTIVLLKPGRNTPPVSREV